jgi:hypothetical protein
LYKQSFSLTTSNGLKLHLISYFTKEDVASGKLTQSSNDPRLKDIHIPLDLYPDTPPGVAVVPAITTVPLMGGPVLPAANVAGYHNVPIQHLHMPPQQQQHQQHQPLHHHHHPAAAIAQPSASGPPGPPLFAQPVPATGPPALSLEMKKPMLPSRQYEFRQLPPTTNAYSLANAGHAPLPPRFSPTNTPPKSDADSTPPPHKRGTAFSEDQRVLGILDSALAI